MTQFYLVMGQYDMVAISEAPDDETAAKMSLGVAACGSVQTETLRAFSEAEYREITGSLALTDAAAQPSHSEANRGAQEIVSLAAGINSAAAHVTRHELSARQASWLEVLRVVPAERSAFNRLTGGR